MWESVKANCQRLHGKSPRCVNVHLDARSVSIVVSDTDDGIVAEETEPQQVPPVVSANRDGNLFFSAKKIIDQFRWELNVEEGSTSRSLLAIFDPINYPGKNSESRALEPIVLHDYEHFQTRATIFLQFYARNLKYYSTN